MSDDLAVAVKLAELRGCMDEGFATVNGKLALISQAQDRTAQDVSELDRRVVALEERRWPLGPMAAVSGIVSVIVAVVAILIGQ